MNSKESFDLFNHNKVSILRRGMYSTSDKSFFRTFSALRSPLKLIKFNCSHRHHSESIVHEGSMIEVVIPVNYFILFHYGLVHCRTLSWFINKDEYP